MKTHRKLNIAIVSGDFIKTQMLAVVGGSAVDLWRWIKADVRGRKKLRHKIVGEDTAHTKLEVLTEEDFRNVMALWLKLAR